MQPNLIWIEYRSRAATFLRSVNERRWIPPCRARHGEYAMTVSRADQRRSETPATPCAGMTILRPSALETSSRRRPGSSVFRCGSEDFNNEKNEADKAKKAKGKKTKAQFYPLPAVEDQSLLASGAFAPGMPGNGNAPNMFLDWLCICSCIWMNKPLLCSI